MNALRGRPLWISASAASAGEKPAGDIGALQNLFTLVGGLYMVGGLLFGLALIRAAVLACWAAALLAVGTVGRPRSRSCRSRSTARSPSPPASP